MKKSISGFEQKTKHGFGEATKHIKLFGLAVGSMLTAEGIMEAGKMAFEFGKKCIEAFQESQEAMVLLQKSFENNGGKVKLSMDEIQSSANNLRMTSFLRTDQIISGVTNRLLTFKNISGDTFERTQQLAVDMSAKFGGLKGAGGMLEGMTTKLGRALSTGNVASLSRMGVVFTKVQQDMLKAMFRSGRQAEAQEIILKELEKTYHGTAQALANTDLGRQMQLAATGREIMEKLGESLSKIKTKIITMANSLLVTFRPIIDRLIAIIDKIANGIMPIFDTLFNVINSLKPIIDAVFDVLNSSIEMAVSNFGDIATVIDAIMQAINPLLPTLSKIWKIFMKINMVLFTLTQPVILFIKIIAMIIRHADRIKEYFKTLILKLPFGDALLKTIIKIRDFFIKVFNGIKNTVKGVLDSIMKNPLFQKILWLFEKASKFLGIKDDDKLPPKKEIPKPNKNEVNAKSEAIVSVYTEKHLKVRPHIVGSNLGYQKVMESR
jgi:phage-related protein